MNSLSMFEGAKNPLASFLFSVSEDYYRASGVRLQISDDNVHEITLPNGKCRITVKQHQVTVTRSEGSFSKDCESVYDIDSIEAAKQMTAILSGICYECGCGSYRDADGTVKLIYRIIHRNLKKEVAHEA